MKTLKFENKSTGCETQVVDDVKNGFYILNTETGITETQLITFSKEAAEKLRDWLVAKYPTEKYSANCFKFSYSGPNNDKCEIEISKDEVVEHMEEQLFQKLTASVCGCDVDYFDDCRCDEYADQFTLVIEGVK